MNTYSTQRVHFVMRNLVEPVQYFNPRHAQTSWQHFTQRFRAS